jgi:DNA-binding response OmpR family regulator
MAGPRILHVDDDPDIRLLMSASMQEFGYQVLTAGTIAEAMQLAQKFRFDLCILDVKLPDGTGIDLCRKLRELFPTTPMLYYSGHADVASSAQALQICGDAYIKKPVSIDELHTTIAYWLEHKKAS